MISEGMLSLIIYLAVGASIASFILIAALAVLDIRGDKLW